MAWTHTIHTAAGLALRQKQLDSNVTIKFTKAMAGTGTVNPAELAVQTGLVNPVQQLDLGRAVHSNGDTSVIIPVTLHNDDLEKDYHVEQVGVYAQDPDAGEILYFISQTDKEGGDEVPGAAKSPGFTLDWNFSLNVGNGSKVEVAVNKVGVLTEEQADDRYVTKEKAEETLGNYYTKEETYDREETDTKMTSDETADSLFGKPVVFAEAEQEINIVSGDTVKIMFGKLLKTIKTFRARYSAIEEEVAELDGELTGLPDQPFSFSEAGTDSNIASGDSLKVMFGKLLKTIKTFRTKHTSIDSSISGMQSTLSSHGTTLQNLSGTTPITRGGTGETARYESVELTRKTANTPADSTATCRYYSYLKMCFARIYIAPRASLTYKAGETYVLYIIPEGYRPETIHAGSCYLGGTSTTKVRINSEGEITIVPAQDITTGWSVYITAFWFRFQDKLYSAS